jgi:hypothetical protein
MSRPKYTIHARERVREFIDETDLDRLAQAACEAAEKSDDWHPGEEFIFYIEEEDYVYPGVELSAFTVRHLGRSYEVLYYDGMMAETITANCSWDKKE